MVLPEATEGRKGGEPGDEVGECGGVRERVYRLQEDIERYV